MQPMQQPYPMQPMQQQVYGQQPYYAASPANGVVTIYGSPTFVRSMFGIALVGLILAAVMLGAPGWFHDSGYGYDVNYGVSRYCYSGYGSTSCGTICPSSSKTTICVRFRVLLAFVILGLAASAVCTILRFMIACSSQLVPSRGRRQFQLVASVLALASFAASLIVAIILLDKDMNGVTPTYCFFFCIINIIISISFVINDYRLLKLPQM